MEENHISGNVVDAAIKVHSTLGPGLLESAYESCLCFELQQRGLKVEQQVELPLFYNGHPMTVSYRLDLLVEDRVVVEVKAVAVILPIHQAQLLTYLRLSRHKLGVLLNFQVAHMRDGIRRMVNNL